MKYFATVPHKNLFALDDEKLPFVPFCVIHA